MKILYLFLLCVIGTSSILSNEYRLNHPLRSRLIQELAPIIIAFRDDTNGKGATYDHYTVQHITDHPTERSVPPGLDPTVLETYINGQGYNLLFGNENEHGKRIPPLCEESYDGGLLIIPGRRDAHLTVDENPSYKCRKPHEQRALKQAYLRGQPVLAICAGSWELWELFGGTITDVHNHQHLPMLTLIPSGMIENSLQAHEVSITKESILAKAMGSYAPTISVNSIHGKAADERSLPDQFIITARTSADLLHGEVETSEQDDAQQSHIELSTVEAFETKHGAPMLGLQFHSEGYYTTAPTTNDIRHMNIVRYMAKAGDAYQAKRRMLRQITEFSEPTAYDITEVVALLLPPRQMPSTPPRPRACQTSESYLDHHLAPYQVPGGSPKIQRKSLSPRPIWQE